MTNTDQDQITEYLRNWADSKTPPRFAVLIDGAWGCGKTHFVKSMFDGKTSITKRKTIYVSLFGLSSVQDLETQLFYASATKGMGTAVKAGLRVDLNGDGKQETNVNGDFKGLNSVVEKFGKNIENSVLIFDDIERCKVDPQTMLGVLNRYVEHTNARVLLIANTQNFEGDDKHKFNQYAEKLVGQRFKISSNPKAAIDTFINEIEPSEHRNILQKHREQLITLHHQSNHNNLRALRQFVWHFAQMLEALDQKYHDNKGVWPR
jgi:Cdc6-like AAA superfamily ATPase